MSGSRPHPPRERRIAAPHLALMVVGLGLAAPPLAHAAAPSPPPAEVRAWQTGLLRTDRLQHASLGLTAGLAVGIVTRRPWAAFGGVAALALGKEIADRRTTGFDPLDLAAGLIGAGGAALVTANW